MAWSDSHSICDVPIANRAAGSGHIGDDFLGMVDGDLATVASAQAAAVVATAALQICDRPHGESCSRGFQIADNMGATFGSTFTAFFASLPTQTHPMDMIHS